jgi:hypothetical protein
MRGEQGKKQETGDQQSIASDTIGENANRVGTDAVGLVHDDEGEGNEGEHNAALLYPQNSVLLLPYQMIPETTKAAKKNVASLLARTVSMLPIRRLR